MLSGSLEGKVKLWNIYAKTEIATLAEVSVPISSLILNYTRTDGLILAFGGENDKIEYL